MGKYDGLRQTVNGSGSSGTDNTSKGSKYDDLRKSMGLIQDDRPKLPDRNNELGNAYMDESRLINDSRQQLVNSDSQPNARPDLPTDYPGGWLNPVNDINALRKTKPGQFVDAFAQGIGRRFGLSDDQMSSPASTGNKTADAIANFAGDITGYVANPAQIEMSVGNTFFNNPIINKVAGKLGNLTDNALAKYTGAAVANTAESRLARGAVEGATKGALGSAAYSPFQTLEQGQDVQNIPGNALTDTIAGGMLGGAFGGAGSLAKSGLQGIASKYPGTKIGDALGKYFDNGPSTIAEPQPQGPMLELPEPRSSVLAREAQQRSVLEPNLNPIAGQGDIHTFGLPEGNYTSPTRLKVNSAENAFHAAYEKVLPASVERMTPPLENETLLAKWVQGHLNDAGHDVSLNEVRTLNYEDMRQLAEEMRGRIKPADVVRKTAHDMGYGKIYDQSTPTIKERIAQDAQNQVYGIYPKKVDIARPESFNISKTASAAAPESKLGFIPKKVKPTIVRDKAMNISAKDPGLVRIKDELPPKPPTGVEHLPGVKGGVDPLSGDKGAISQLTSALDRSAEWKDKPKLSLRRETMERNFEDIMGKDAPIMKKAYIEPIQKAAADRQRFITSEREDLKKLGIKYKSKEDKLTQQYGEGKITEQELQAASPDNWKNIKDAAETFRAKYDKYLDLANKSLERNGYSPIPKRADYFPHYEEIDGVLSKFGIRLEDNTVPTDLNGITANLKPGKNFFSHALRRKGDETTFGALEGHDRYIEGISKLIYQIDNIKRLRGLDKELRSKFEGSTHLSNFVSELTDYTNLVAGKKTELDRSAEALLGRNLYTAADALKRRVGGNMIGGSVSSALTNSIPLTQLAASTNKISLVKGLTSALENIKGNDEIAQKSDFLNRKFTSNKLALGALDKAQNVAGSLFKAIDHFTSNVVIRSKYYENLNNKGMSPDDAMKAADQYATKMMADRSEGSMPTMFKSKTVGILTQFQLEVNNQLSHLFKDMPKDMSKAKYAGAITQVFIYDYLYNQLYEKITGNRPAFDPIGVAVEAVQDYSNPRLQQGKATKNLIQNVSNNLPFVSTLTGGRIPIGAAVPNLLGVAQGTANLKDELIKPAKYLALPFGGSQINKTLTGATNLGLNPMYSDKSGIYGTDSNGETALKYPIGSGPANITRGLLFGKSAFPETNNFYRNNNQPLSADQTKFVDSSSDRKGTYDSVLLKRDLESVVSKIKKVAKDKGMTDKEKENRIATLQRSMTTIQKQATR